MLGDAQTGKINIIVVKDLSRFGRNYIEVGRYIDYIFPMNNIRFIALNDGVDTADRDSAALEMMPIVNLVSAQYGQNPKATYLPIFLFQMNNKKEPPQECSCGGLDLYSVIGLHICCIIHSVSIILHEFLLLQLVLYP